jgi:hypothetical protein
MDELFAISNDSLALGMGVVMTLALVAALVASKRRTGLLLTPVTFFFIFIFVHALFGRYAASVLAAKYTFVNPAALEPFLDQSFIIISTGITSCLLAFLLIPSFSSGRVAASLARVSCEEAFGQICSRSRVLIVIAIPLIVIGLQQLGGIPLLSDSPRHDRYLLNFTPEHRLDTFLVNRGREIIVFPAAALAVAWFFGKRRAVDILFVALAAVSCLLTATRAPLLIGVLVVTVMFVWRGHFRAVCLIGAAALAGLIGSEVALGVDSSPGTSEWTTLERIGADVSEVRDLAWTLRKHDEPYWGRTFLAGLLPIPAAQSDFTETYHLRTITLEAIGIPLTAAHGGLRITYSGEWFLNFGWPGVVMGGVLNGWMCSRFSSLFHRLRNFSLYPSGAFAVACAWVSLSFMIYMAGTGAGGTLKTYCAALAVLLLRLRQAPQRFPFSHTATLEPRMMTR